MDDDLDFNLYYEDGGSRKTDHKYQKKPSSEKLKGPKDSKNTVKPAPHKRPKKQSRSSSDDSGSETGTNRKNNVKLTERDGRSPKRVRNFTNEDRTEPKRRKKSPTVANDSNVFNMSGSNYNKDDASKRAFARDAIVTPSDGRPAGDDTNILPPSDYDNFESSQILKPNHINDELELLNGKNNVATTSESLLKKRIEHRAEITRKARRIVNGSFEFAVEKQQDEEMSRSSESREERQRADRSEDIFQSIGNSVIYKNVQQTPIFNKYDVEFIVANSDDNYINLNRLTADSGYEELPHIYNLLIQRVRNTDALKGVRRIRLLDDRDIDEEKEVDGRSDVIVDDEISVPTRSNDVVAMGRKYGSPDYERPLGFVLEWHAKKDDRNLYNSFKSNYHVDITYDRQMCWISTDKLHDIIKKYAQMQPDRITEHNHCVAVCHLFNTYFKKRKNFEIKLRNFIDLVKLKHKLIKSNDNVLNMRDADLPTCLSDMHETHISILLSKLNVTKCDLLRLKCVTNEWLFKCWKPFEGYAHLFSDYASFAAFLTKNYPVVKTSDGPEYRRFPSEKMSKDFYYFDLFRRVVSFEKIKAWDPSVLCQVRSKGDGQNGHMRTITNALGDLIVKLLDQTSYISTSAAGTPQTTDANTQTQTQQQQQQQPPTTGTIEAQSKEKLVYDAGVLKILKETTDIHLKYFRETARTGYPTANNKYSKLKTLGHSEKDGTSKTHPTNQVQVQVVNTPYMLTSNGSTDTTLKSR